MSRPAGEMPEDVRVDDRPADHVRHEDRAAAAHRTAEAAAVRPGRRAGRDAVLGGRAGVLDGSTRRGRVPGGAARLNRVARVACVTCPSAPDPRRSSSTSLTEYDFGPAHPMSPVRVDLTMRLAERARRARPAAACAMVPAPIADDDLIAHRARPRADRGGAAGSATTRRRRRGARARHRRQPGLRGHAPRRRARGRRDASRRSARSGPARACTRPTSPAACTTRCATGPAASASTTTSRSASSTSSTRAPSGWRTSTSTSTTATASSRSSGTTRGC